jgi:acyl-ACP thioesterase
VTKRWGGLPARGMFACACRGAPRRSLPGMDDRDLVPPAEGGRVFVHPVLAGLADVAPSGRVRLDAIARWLQDAALADVVDAGLDEDGAWVVRRARLVVERFPRFGEALELATFCSGTGPMVAERRTVVRAGDEVVVQAVAAWVHVDPVAGRPRPLPDSFAEVYGASAAGRRVRARLRHPAEPPPDAAARPWRFRAADLDLAGHVNNAVYWQVLEEDLVATEPPHGIEAEIEHRAAADAGEAAVLGLDGMRWVTGPNGEVVATLEVDSGDRES